MKVKEIYLNLKECKDYQISNFGNVRSLKNNKVYNLKGRLGKNGYLRVYLSTNEGKRKDFSIHRLVAQYFLLNNQNYKCVNHKDGNKLNNNVDNLEWCTHAQNNLHAYKNNLNSQEHRGIKFKIGKQIYSSVLEASKKLSISRKTITNRINSGMYEKCD